MPNTGTPAPSTPRIASTAYPAAAGSPGPLLKNTPSGEAARMSVALLVAGSTRTSQPRAARFRGVDALMPRSTRSEEHTSELQSRSDLVCRLLLEKKNKKQILPQ